MKGYRQYCPVARGAEIFAQRWTPVIVRCLLLGSTTFSDILAGSPGIPRTLLTHRLRELERVGVIERRPAARGSTYHLTESGNELGDVCDALGRWGARWLDMAPEHLDCGVVLWSMCRQLDRDRLPPQRVVLRFDITDATPNRYWLLVSRHGSEVCRKPPGTTDNLIVTTDTATLHEWHMGRISYSAARRTHRLRVDGPPALVRALPTWGGLSKFADIQPAHPVW